jgi:hypothetical protein
VTQARRARLVLAVRLAVLAAVVAGFAALLRGIDLSVLGAAIRRANLGIVLLAACLSFALMGWKALRVRVMLAPFARVGALRLYRYTILSCAASTLLPARAGEVVRVWLLVKRDQVPVRAAATVSATEKIFDALGMLLVVSPLLWLLPELPVWVPRAIELVAAVVAAGLVAGWLLLRWGGRGPRLARYVPGLEVLRRPRGFAAALGFSLAMWLTDLAALQLVLVALDVQIPFGGSLLVLLAVNVAITLPAAPAHVGSFELGAVVALGLLHVGREEALAFALVYHAMQALPLAIIGLAELRFILATLNRGASASAD